MTQKANICMFVFTIKATCNWIGCSDCDISVITLQAFHWNTALRLQQDCMMETTINNKKKFLECNTMHINVYSQYLAIQCLLQAIVLKNHICKKNMFLFFTKSFTLTFFPIKILQNYKFNCCVLSKHFYYLDPRQTVVYPKSKSYNGLSFD